jgi:hypothetical protein
MISTNDFFSQENLWAVLRLNFENGGAIMWPCWEELPATIL